MVFNNGWVPVWRSIWDNPILRKSDDILVVWLWLLTNVQYEDGYEVNWCGGTRKLKKGEITISLDNMLDSLNKHKSSKQKMNKSRLYRILNTLKSETMIETQRGFNCLLISIVNWDKYNKSETQNEIQVKFFRNSPEILSEHKEKDKENKKEKNVYYSGEHQELSTGKKYSKKHQEEMDKLTGYKPINDEVAKKLDALRRRLEENANN